MHWKRILVGAPLALGIWAAASEALAIDLTGQHVALTYNFGDETGVVGSTVGPGTEFVLEGVSGTPGFSVGTIDITGNTITITHNRDTTLGPGLPFVEDDSLSFSFPNLPANTIVSVTLTDDPISQWFAGLVYDGTSVTLEQVGTKAGVNTNTKVWTIASAVVTTGPIAPYDFELREFDVQGKGGQPSFWDDFSDGDRNTPPTVHLVDQAESVTTEEFGALILTNSDGAAQFSASPFAAMIGLQDLPLLDPNAFPFVESTGDVTLETTWGPEAPTGLGIHAESLGASFLLFDYIVPGTPTPQVFISFSDPADEPVVPLPAACDTTELVMVAAMIDGVTGGATTSFACDVVDPEDISGPVHIRIDFSTGGDFFDFAYSLDGGTTMVPSSTWDAPSGPVAVPEAASKLLIPLAFVLAREESLFAADDALNGNAPADAGDDSDVQLATDGTTWMAVWTSTDSLSGTIGSDADILIARSSDSGATWSMPVALHGSAASDAGDDVRPQLATDGLGKWVAIWESDDTLSGTVGTDPDIFVSTSIDAGLSWSAPTALNTNATTDSSDDQEPDLATDGAGNWVAVWHSDDTLAAGLGSDLDVFVSRSNDGATWSTPVALNSNAATDTQSDWFPEIATDEAGTWIVVWSSADTFDGTLGADSDIIVASSSNAGVTWTNAVALNANAEIDTGEDIVPRLAADGAGTWIALWQSQEDLGAIGTDWDIFLSRSLDGGATWGTPQALAVYASNDSSNDGDAEIATDGLGNWVAAWHSANPFEDFGGSVGADDDIVVARSNDGGVTWTNAGPPSKNGQTDTGSDARPVIATDGHGSWALAWQSDDSFGGTIATDLDIIVSVGEGPDLDRDGLTDGAEASEHGTDPADPDTDGDGLDDGVEVALGSGPTLPDTDFDGICDGPNSPSPCNLSGPDNCPFVANFDQNNSDPFSAGDACQCGDANSNNAVDAQDLALVREWIVGATLSGTLAPERCDYVGAVGCGIDDAFVLQRLIEGADDTFEDACTAYGAP